MCNMIIIKKMNTGYTILASIIGLLLMFLYLSWLYVSAKFVWIKDNDNSGLKKNPRPWKNIIDSKNKNVSDLNNNLKRWKNVVDPKNENLGWFDLGNHIIILGVVLFAIFIVKNA